MSLLENVSFLHGSWYNVLSARVEAWHHCVIMILKSFSLKAAHDTCCVRFFVCIADRNGALQCNISCSIWNYMRAGFLFVTQWALFAAIELHASLNNAFCKYPSQPKNPVRSWLHQVLRLVGLTQVIVICCGLPGFSGHCLFLKIHPSYFWVVYICSTAFHFLDPYGYPFMGEKGNKEYSVLYFFYDCSSTKGPMHFASAHDSSFVFFIALSGVLADVKHSLLHPMAAHSPWQPCAQSESSGSACSNDLISVLPRQSRWEHRCADCPLSHNTEGPTHAILHYLSSHRAINIHSGINLYIPYFSVCLVAIPPFPGCFSCGGCTAS